MSRSKRSKSKLSLVIALTALLTVILALVLPQVYLISQTFNPNDVTNIFGFTSTFGGTISPVGSTTLEATLFFNVGAFIPLVLIILGATITLISDKQFSAYVFSSLLYVASGILFLFSKRFVEETNAFIPGFSNYLYVQYGTYVAIGLCVVLLIEACIGAYLIKSDYSRRHR